ncbi:uncharacterized protein LOC132744157 [Ruditapes philippinarum]|uniref:uncharacterized protein LOC132744157 n=1 Tax=Ruditapes philippinarum TaxID=129788 RepID=UPI00295AA8B3|nr:uncharacterized protein LOC132744157 [Ruditapes philippinarum]
MPNSQIPFIGDFVRIVCSISNKYFPPLSSTDQSESDVAMAAKMVRLLEKENELQKKVEKTGLDRKQKVWKNVDEEDIYFPVLNSEQLSELTLGVYQLSLSPSYIQEHLDGEFDIKVNIDDPKLLCVKMQSRHSSSKRYMLWIQVENEAVDGWYCTCRCGSRVVGMCAHIAAIVWYLSNGRHSGRESYGVRDWGVHLSDAAEFKIDVAIDESSGSDTD